MIWIEHVVHVLMSVADRLYVINFGQELAQGLPQDVMNNHDVRRVYMGWRFEMSAPLLQVHSLTAFYKDAQAGFGIDFELHAGEMVVIIDAGRPLHRYAALF
jgi:ABC-type branched-subunit amino acid transport system ATPase component